MNENDQPQRGESRAMTADAAADGPRSALQDDALRDDPLRDEPLENDAAQRSAQVPDGTRSSIDGSGRAADPAGDAGAMSAGGTGSAPGTPMSPDQTAGGWADLVGDTVDLRSRWSAVQTGFVDEPRRAVEDARGLVGEVVHRLTSSFDAQTKRLEDQWASGEAGTEDLRVALRSYRTFFETLLGPDDHRQ